MAPSISVFLPSYNKGAYVIDALQCLFAQTRTDWECWLLENSTDGGTTRDLINDYLTGVDWADRIHYEELDNLDDIRASKYMTAWLLNKYYPEANGRYIFYLSDDDLIDADCFEHMAGYLDANPDHGVCYAGLRQTYCSGPGVPGDLVDIGIPASYIRRIGGSVDCQLDGGQVMHRKSCLDAIPYPYFQETCDGSTARHCDGLFLEQLLARYAFYPVDRYLITHRFTPKSVWTQS